MMVLTDNQPVYIEEFFSHDPDWANNLSPTGDPDPELDWLPAFRRAAYQHLTTLAAEPLRFQRTYQRPVFVGRSRSQYKLSDTLHLFGLRLEGLYPRVELHFHQGTDGIHLHYPKTDAGAGTSFALPAPLTDYGGSCTLRNLLIRGTNAAGTRGVIIQRTSLLEAVQVFDFGWHGFHVTADVTRHTDSPDGAISNANGTTLLGCWAHHCGHVPGLDPDNWQTAANPAGYRPLGSGLRLEGGDANICYTRSFSGSHCARWAIDDVGFLGNQHVLPHCDNCRHEVTPWERDISTHPTATEAEERDFRTYHTPAGQPVQFAYHIENPNARSILMAPYVENAQITPLVDVRLPSLVIGGIGGRDTDQTTRVKAAEFTNLWKFVSHTAHGSPNETWLSEGNGVFITLAAMADHPQHHYRLKYVPFKDDDKQQAGESDPWAGFFRLDRANLNAQMALALTGGNSYEKTSRGALARQLEAGRLVMLPHYRAANFTHFRKVEYGDVNTLDRIEATFPAANREIGDAYICLKPVAGGVYEAVVIGDPPSTGRKKWAKVSQVQS